MAGGATGAARVYDAATGELLQSWQLASGTTFINDVVVTGDTAWFTDSLNPVLYGVRLGDDEPTALPLTGDLQFVSGFNTNGIETTDGTTLVVVQSPTGLLFTVDPATGVTDEIDLGGETVVNGDGLLFADGFLYVVQNQRNQIARVDLADDLTSGTVVTRLTDPDLDVPTTVGRVRRSAVGGQRPLRHRAHADDLLLGRLGAGLATARGGAGSHRPAPPGECSGRLAAVVDTRGR